MDQSAPSDIFWRVASLILWLYLFLVGLLPRSFFDRLRELGAVRTQNALVNSEYLITIGLALFIGYFVLQRCREAGLSQDVARGHAAQLATMALVAFVPLENGILAVLDGPHAIDRYLVLSAISLKLFAWCYLLSVIVRSYVWGGLRVFRQLTSIFPSVQRELRRSGSAEETPHEAASTNEATDL